MSYKLGIGDASDNDTSPATDWALAKTRLCDWGLVRGTTTGKLLAGTPQLRVDGQLVGNAESMQLAGVERATYAWFDPRVKKVSAVDQAHFYLEATRKIGVGEKGTVIDLEDVPAQGIYANRAIGEHIWAFAAEIRKHTLELPRLYTNLAYVSSYLFTYYMQQPWLSDFELVVASWGGSAPTVPLPWAPCRWRAWQFRRDAPGAWYGFYPVRPGAAAPRICLAIWQED